MTQYLLLNRIKVQNANAISGFTWGFPAITHFLGFTHNLSLKLKKSKYQHVSLNGCAVVAHEHHVHTFGKYNDKFLQSKNPAYLSGDVNKVVQGRAPSIVEEGKMNMIVTLVIDLDGFLGREVSELLSWIKQQCLMQRLAGGSILSIDDVQLFDGKSQQDFFKLKRVLMPGFALMDRANYLAEYYQACLDKNLEAEQLEAWLDFSALKQQARPLSALIAKHLQGLDEVRLYDIWLKHLAQPYSANIPQELIDYFSQLEETKKTKPLLKQWNEYVNPTNKTDAKWEYLSKPNPGYLVPIMTGYKAISPVYDNRDVANTRDSETPVCFVESVHSVGEWLGINRLKNNEDIVSSLWNYEYENGWYLCQQTKQSENHENDLDQQVAELFDPIDELI
ncbi:type I-F CRISPR-associated protein Csy2 [Shewanella algidipiscicola]|uniref:type I-F CRISPR-associated protein Csy2 n=1 Tax=Shewanella algidipiscicola TaxID=614070 RepID=UPI000D788A47|nr:type I-F CRISPR-associated protein Csy2 [Shewanella algidipiscicola]